MNTCRKLLSALLCLALLASVLPLGVQPARAAGDNTLAGNGTPESPYQIKDAEDLLEFARRVNYYDPSKPHSQAEERDAWAELVNDIDLKDTVWTRIGSWSSFPDLEYIGTFDGKDHIIRGLNINLADSTNSDDYQGLFGVIGENGVVKNLTVEGSITIAQNSYYRVGGVAGQNEGTVNNCISHVEINVTADVSSEYGEVYSGGVVGLNFGTVENCSNSVAVNTSGASAFAGGIVGANGVDSGTVSGCYNTGTVNGTTVGGIAGANLNTISGCYNTGTVTGTTAGGVVGENCSEYFSGDQVGHNFGTVNSCYNTGTITGTTVGGVVGVNSNAGGSGTVDGCYFLVGTAASGVGDNSSTNVTNVASKTTEEFASGEVAWLLQDALGENDSTATQVWGQQLNGETSEDYPVLLAFVEDAPEVYRVAFEYNYDYEGTENAAYTNSGGTVSAPTEPKREGYAFGGWYSDESLTDDWNFGTDTVTEDINLYAKWTVCTYTVTFNTNGGSDVDSQTVAHGGKVTKPEAPTKTGYTFAGWYSDANFNTPWNFDTNTVSGNMTLYAKWNINQYTVTFNTNGGSDVDSLSVDYGDIVTKPADPTRDGYTFAGWYSDESLATAWNFETDTVSKDTTLYAKWTEIPTYTVTVAASSHGSVTVNPTSAAAGEMVTLTIAPETGYTLSGLNVADANGTAITVNGSENTYTFTMPDSAVTVTATFRLIEEPVDPDPTPTPDPDPSGPSTGESDGWESIADEITAADDGDSITIDMNGETEVPAEIFEDVAGKDVDLVFDMGDGLSWSVNGQDIPEGTNLTDLDLGVDLGTDGIPVDVINAITGEKDSVQITLAYDGEFGFTLTLTAPLGEDNAGYWANLYHYDEDTEAMNFEAAAEIGADGSVSLPLSHASQYAIVIDDHSHAATDVSEIFTDVPANHWAQAAIQYVYDNGLMTGVSDTAFAPEATTTRAMIVSMLARMENVTSAADAGFTDVAADDWYATAVNWAAANGIVNGISDDTFAPNDPITREQLAAMLMNYAQWKGQDTSARADLSGYSDAPSTWASEAVQWAAAEGLLAGVTDDELQPQGQATRAQVAAIMQRFLEA